MDSSQRAKQLIIDKCLHSDTQIVDAPTCLEWIEWMGSKKVATTNAESTSQV